MLELNTLNTSSAYGSHRTKSNFGRRDNDFQRITNVLTEENHSGKSEDEFRAEKLEKLAEIISENKNVPSALKSFGVVASLSFASGLTASLLTGRFYNFLNQTTPYLGKIGRFALNNLAKTQEHVAKAAEKQTGFKATVLNAGNKTLVWLKDLSKSGVKKELAEIAHKDQEELARIQKRIIKAAEKKGKNLTSEQTEAEVQKYLQAQTEEVMGANLLKKVAKAGVGTTAGLGTLKETAADENHDGIPDVVQGKDAHKKATEQLTAALFDCALDSCGL